MLEFKINKFVDKLSFEGSIADIVSESTWMIRRIYQRLLIKNPDAAVQFKDLVSRVTAEDGPVWKDADSMKDVLVEKLEELAEILKGLGEK